MFEPRSIPRVLVADDQPDVLTALGLLLRATGFEAETVPSVQAVRDRLTPGSYDLLLMDLNYARDTTSGREGLDLLTEIHERDHSLPIIVMTGWGSIDTAVEAMRRGARTFVSKPWDNRTLTEAIRREINQGISAREAEARASLELHGAQEIQRSLLPSTLPALPGFELAARWQPASAFGGDCYDARGLSDGCLALSIADVAGKGLPAALLMSNLQASVRAVSEREAAPNEIAGNVNRLMRRNTDHSKFVTLFYGFLDASTRTLSYCNAGHTWPVLVRADGSIDRLSKGGLPLGIFEDAHYERGETVMRLGDRLVLFTDGITEARNGNGEEFADALLIDTILRHRHEPAARLVDAVMDAVRGFAGDSLQDDATVIVLAIDRAADSV